MTSNNPQLSNCCKAEAKDHLSIQYPDKTAEELRGKTNYFLCMKCKQPCDVQEPTQKPAWLEGHACRFNDGEQTCDCFVEGYQRGNSTEWWEEEMSDLYVQFIEDPSAKTDLKDFKSFISKITKAEYEKGKREVHAKMLKDIKQAMKDGDLREANTEQFNHFFRYEIY